MKFYLGRDPNRVFEKHNHTASIGETIGLLLHGVVALVVLVLFYLVLAAVVLWAWNMVFGG